MEGEELRSLVSQLLHGNPSTRRRASQRLLRRGDSRSWSLLVGTVRSDGPWRLRARCLEALGLAAGSADQETAERILNALLAPEGQLHP